MRSATKISNNINFDLENYLNSVLNAAESNKRSIAEIDDRSEFEDADVRYKKLYCADSTTPNVLPKDVYMPIVFTDVDSSTYGVPPIAKVFKNFVLGAEVLPFWKDAPTSKSKTVENIEMRYIYEYLKHPEFTDVSILQTSRNDHIVYGIFAYILQWSVETIIRFGSEFQGIRELVNWLAVDKQNFNTVSYRGYPVNPRIFRILTWHFNRDLNDSTEQLDNDTVDECVPRNFFTLSLYVSSEWISHFQHVYERLLSETWTQAEDSTFFDNVRSSLGVPFARFLNTKTTAGRSRPKYITGVACCGKTTVLTRLVESGWQFVSRSDMGTFSGKSKAPAYVASLHAAIDETLRAGSEWIIGDRGPIDNPLWTVIMQLCDPKHRDSVVPKLLRFFESTFNEPVIRYHAEFDVIVFLDQYPSRNRRRMMMRNEDGDAHRSRIAQYVPIQFMAYYMFASLFGFTTIFVPYDRQTGEFDSKAHDANALKVKNYYGDATLAQTRLVDKRNQQQRLRRCQRYVASKLNGEVPEFMDDNTFPIVYGIFK